MNAERLAAVGQTVAALSHHIKNILQGLLTGGDLVERGVQGYRRPAGPAGLADRPQEPGENPRAGDGHALVLQGAREPTVEPTDLNVLARDVVELMGPRARERQVRLEAETDDTLPPAAGRPGGYPPGAC
ncbi:MAG: hypothetical protein U0736_09915 [Gemmataceae bacterium]